MTKTKLWTCFWPVPLLLDPFYIIEVGGTGRRHAREDIASDELGIHRQIGRGEMPWDRRVVVIKQVAYIPGALIPYLEVCRLLHTIIKILLQNGVWIGPREACVAELVADALLGQSDGEVSHRK